MDIISFIVGFATAGFIGIIIIFFLNLRKYNEINNIKQNWQDSAMQMQREYDMQDHIIHPYTFNDDKN